MSANVDGMLRAAIEAFKNGNKTEARTLLDKVLEVDEYNENAWMWMSAVVDNADDRRTCLENVLSINPNNEKAKKGMKALGVDPDATSLVPSQAAPSVFTDTSFASGTSGGSSVWDEDDEDDAPPTASSSASSTSFRAPSVSSNDLDDWISGMGIGSSGKQPALSPTSNPFSASSFDTDTDADPMLGLDDDFDDLRNSMFSEDEFDLDDSPPPPAKPAASSRPAAQPARPTPSPSVFDDDDDDAASLFEDDDALGVSDEDFDEFNALLEDEVPALPPVRTTSTRPAIARGSDYAVEEVQFDDEEEGPDPSALFALIPKEIEASDRLPGESEPSPRALIIGIVVLVVLNVGALGLFLMNGMS